MVVADAVKGMKMPLDCIHGLHITGLSAWGFMTTFTGLEGKEIERYDVTSLDCKV